MPEIRQLSAVSSVSDADAFPVWSSGAGDTRKVSGSTLTAYIADPLQAQIDDCAKLAESNAYTAAQASTMTNLGTVTGTVTLNCSLGNSWRMVLGGNITMALPANPMDGQYIGLHIIQDGTGSRTITWNSAFKWQGGSAPTLSTAASSRDFISLAYDSVSTVWIGSLSVKGAA